MKKKVSHYWFFMIRIISGDLRNQAIFFWWKFGVKSMWWSLWWFRHITYNISLCWGAWYCVYIRWWSGVTFIWWYCVITTNRHDMACLCVLKGTNFLGNDLMTYQKHVLVYFLARKPMVNPYLSKTNTKGRKHTFLIYAFTRIYAMNHYGISNIWFNWPIYINNIERITTAYMIKLHETSYK